MATLRAESKLLRCFDQIFVSFRKNFTPKLPSVCGTGTSLPRLSGEE